MSPPTAADPACSQKRRDANRESALKSTGPRTPEGEKRARFNALKHGLTAATPVLPGEDAATCVHDASAYAREIAKRPIADLKPPDAARAVPRVQIERHRARVRLRLARNQDLAEAEAADAPDLLAFDPSPEGEKRRYLLATARLINQTIKTFLSLARIAPADASASGDILNEGGHSDDCAWDVDDGLSFADADETRNEAIAPTAPERNEAIAPTAPERIEAIAPTAPAAACDPEPAAIEGLAPLRNEAITPPEAPLRNEAIAPLAAERTEAAGVVQTSRPTESRDPAPLELTASLVRYLAGTFDVGSSQVSRLQVLQSMASAACASSAGSRPARATMPPQAWRRKSDQRRGRR